MKVQFRQATEADFDFLNKMHAACLKEHVERIYPWNPDLFGETFNPHLIRVILVNQIEVGMLQLLQCVGELYLGNLLILPKFQNRGIGTLILQSILDQGQASNLPVQLQVLKQNPAKRLYERLGFISVGETKTHYIMQYSPALKFGALSSSQRDSFWQQ
ncbi:N-acetyltransferase [Trichocoleus sp. FACHB-262]|uniref:GNAT family N-acetyltransferase n=1 Tax=Trichocoleus sp. FACHB-262 TaxID=2692869 RepID=UPI0016898D85|nr:GNAT family N-acetyltransferase [Trichocoleus sp. FACHB-262]MBD2121193.1 GNAT family N-acetyltransferase [Trichocoleus sp. FACHB-262]